MATNPVIPNNKGSVGNKTCSSTTWAWTSTPPGSSSVFAEVVIYAYDVDSSAVLCSCFDSTSHMIRPPWILNFTSGAHLWDHPGCVLVLSMSMLLPVVHESQLIVHMTYWKMLRGDQKLLCGMGFDGFQHCECNVICNHSNKKQQSAIKHY